MSSRNPGAKGTAPSDVCSYGAILAKALPAIFLNLATPAGATVITALLGRKDSDLLAAFTVVTAAYNFCTFLFNYLVDGVCAKVGELVGRRDWLLLRQRVRLVLLCTLAAAAAGTAALAVAQWPVLHLARLDARVESAARRYWWLKVASLPVQLLFMAAMGTVQGYGHVAAATALSVARAVAECAGAAVAILGTPSPEGRPPQIPGLPVTGLVGVGVAALLVGAVCAALGWLMVVAYGRGLSATGPDSASTSSSAQAARTAESSTPSLKDAGLLEFIRDGANMLVRSALMQLSFLLAMLCSSRLGTGALSGYQIILQLWMATSYAADGFATAATVLMSRGLGELSASAGHGSERSSEAMALRRSLRRLATRVLVFGALVGAACSALYAIEKRPLLRLFTRDREALDAIERGPLWTMLCVFQPINALAFVYDGLMYAGQGFAYLSRSFAVGMLLCYAPFIVTAFVLEEQHRGSLAWVWGAKAAFNVWRVVSCAWFVETRVLRTPREVQGEPRHGIREPLLAEVDDDDTRQDEQGTQ